MLKFNEVKGIKTVEGNKNKEGIKNKIMLQFIVNFGIPGHILQTNHFTTGLF